MQYASLAATSLGTYSKLTFSLQRFSQKLDDAVSAWTLWHRSPLLVFKKHAESSTSSKVDLSNCFRATRVSDLHIPFPLHLEPLPWRFRPHGIPTLFITLDVVAAEVPTLLSLEKLDTHSLVADNDLNRLVMKVPTSTDKKSNNPHRLFVLWNVPLKRSNGNLYAEKFFLVMTYFTRL